ncbi:MAG: response regulator transcription factor [Chitinophagaceae bacterium]|nr:response regulator transcription factor [Anaerolineae bacterium]
MIKNLFNRGKDIPSVSVMVVSDDTEVLTFLNETLTANGYMVYSVAGGAAAVSVLDEIAMPDVFIGDFINPEIDGKDFLGKIQIRFGKTALPPVLFLMDTPEDETVAQAMGVSDVLSKPLEKETLLEHLKEIVKHARPPGQS